MSLRAALRPALRAATASARVAPRAAPAAFVAAARFHASARAMGSGQTDGELTSTLAAEYAYESESTDKDKKPAFLQEFEDEGVWTVSDIAASDDVVITRKFGDETLKLTFQVSDLDNAEPMDSLDEHGNPIEDAVEPAYITSSLLVSKNGAKKALLIDLGAGPDGIDVTNVAIYDKALAEADGAEGDWTRRSRYMGPQFDTLDQAVQDAFVEYLAERGINEALAQFIVNFSEHKEQKDYVSWLSDVKEFVNA